MDELAETVNRRRRDERVAFAAIRHHRVPPVVRLRRARRREPDRHQRREDEEHRPGYAAAALRREHEEDRGEPRVERRLLDHDRASREQPGEDEPETARGAEVAREREQREHRREGREELAREREGLDEGRRGERRQQQPSRNRLYAPADPKGHDYRGDDDDDGNDRRQDPQRLRRAASDVEEAAEDEQQALRAIDPGTVIEPDTALPQSSDLGVAPLVRGERRAPERGARADGDRRGDESRERWGPPRADLDARTIALAGAVLGLVLAAAIGLFGLTLSPDRYALLLLGPALVLRRGRRYLLDFAPFVALIVVYAECRGLAHVLRPDPYFLPHLELERALFAGRVPASVLQQWLWSGHERWYDTLVLAVTRIHQFVPLTLAFVLWVRRRALFYRFAATMLLLSFAAALTFLVYPAAPPWHAAEHELLTVEKIGGHASSRVSALWAPYDLAQGNPDAAIPSLHAGYAFLVFLFVAMLAWRTRWRWPLVFAAALYPAAQSYAAVYTGNHYVVDLLIGFVYAVAAFVAVGGLWRSLRLPAADGWASSGSRSSRRQPLDLAGRSLDTRRRRDRREAMHSGDDRVGARGESGGA